MMPQNENDLESILISSEDIQSLLRKINDLGYEYTSCLNASLTNTLKIINYFNLQSFPNLKKMVACKAFFEFLDSYLSSITAKVVMNPARLFQYWILYENKVDINSSDLIENFNWDREHAESFVHLLN